MIKVGDTVSFKRMGNSADMSLGKVIDITKQICGDIFERDVYFIKSIQVEFTTKKHTWDKETRRWKKGTFVRTIKNLKHMEIIHA